METKKFIDILEIYNGKNQKSVENPDGKYPIYGSGGVMGRADEYICPAETVVIGRKGSINNPIFVTEPFWNVDTAFGLVARKEVLLPKYLFYFCRYFDFEKLNTTVTIPSLTKANLLKIEIPIPSIIEQKSIVTKLNLLTDMIQQRQEQLTKLDELIKARFVEMFENNTYPKVKVSTVCDFITKGTTPPNDLISEEYSSDKVPYLKVYNLSFNGELLFDTAPQYISENIHNGMLARSKVYPNDVLMNIVGPPLGKFSLVTDEFPEWNINQAIAIFRAKEKINPKYLLSALMQPEVLNPFLRQAVGIRQLNLSLSQCRDLEIFLPPLSLQNQFADFVAEVDKSKVEVVRPDRALCSVA